MERPRLLTTLDRQAKRSLDWGAVVVAGIAAAYFASLVPYGFHLGEDGDVIYLPYRTYCGQRPYIDFASGYTPGFFHLNAALFRLFGVDILVLRWSVALVNTLTVLALYRLAGKLMPRSLAAVPALAYAALMLVIPGEYASFNVPYPAWHVAFTWVASTLAFLRFCDGGRVVWALVAGLLAGAGCALKPNTGAFNLAALALGLLLACPPDPAWWRRAVRLFLLVGVLVSVAAVFGFRVLNRDAQLLLWPLFAVAGVSGVASLRRGSGEESGPPFVPGLCLLLAGFAAVIAPGIAYYWLTLGTEGLLRDVLYWETAHELFYYVAIRRLDAGDAALGLAATAGILAPKLIRRFHLRPNMVLVIAGTLAAGAGLLLLRSAPMPEGFVRAVTQRLQHLAFGAAILAHWGSAVLVARAWGRGTLAAGGPQFALIAVAVGAPAMFLSMYPRSDFFHWVLSAPVTLVVGVLFYWRIACAWHWSPSRAWVSAAPLYAVLLLLAWPGLTTAARLRMGDAQSLTVLDVDRAPIVYERGRRGRLDDLQAVVEYVRRYSRPDDTLLGFPNLHFINLLTGRHVPGRFGSFSPGWPDHVVEAEIVSDLQARRTRLIVLNRDPQLFLGHAPLYYFQLRTYVRRHYQLAARFGSYDVLRRVAPGTNEPGVRSEESGAGQRSAPPSSLTPYTPPDCAAAVAEAERLMPESALVLAPCWQAGDPLLQERAAAAARSSSDPAGAPPLADALKAGRLASRAELQAVRVLSVIADARSIPAMISALGAVDGRAQEELKTAIFNTATRELVARWLFFPGEDYESTVRGDVTAEVAALTWLEPTEQDPRLRFAGAWIAGAQGRHTAVAGLRRMLAEEDLGLRWVASDALVRMGIDGGVIESLLLGLERDEMLLPSAVLAWSQANPEAARKILPGVLGSGTPLQRETLAFLASALGDAALGDAVEPGLAHPSWRVRAASVWTLGVLGSARSRALIERVAEQDPVEIVRRFARMGMGWLAADHSAADGGDLR